MRKKINLKKYAEESKGVNHVDFWKISAGRENSNSKATRQEHVGYIRRTPRGLMWLMPSEHTQEGGEKWELSKEK